MRFYLILASAIPLAACTGSINETTIKDMPTGYICRILDSIEYLSLPSEQRTIYGELEKRKETCVDSTQRVIIKEE